MNNWTKSYQESVTIPASPPEIFGYINDHARFSSHMSKSSLMMGGGKMETKTDEGKGQRVGSHIQMSGKVCGLNLFLDEVVTQYEPPFKKVWETVGQPNLLVIGGYQMGVEISPQDSNSGFKVFINYELPQKHKWLGSLFGATYAKWCVEQMLAGVQSHFNHPIHNIPHS